MNITSALLVGCLLFRPFCVRVHKILLTSLMLVRYISKTPQKNSKLLANSCYLNNVNFGIKQIKLHDLAIDNCCTSFPDIQKTPFRLLKKNSNPYVSKHLITYKYIYHSNKQIVIYDRKP